jgi:hypothetical protein
MNELIVASVLCDHCGRDVPAESDGCAECRHVPAVAQRNVPTIAQRAPVLPPALERRWVAIAIVLCAGPIGLPLVWLSSRFSRLAKISLSASFVLLTVIVPIALVWYWCEVPIRPLVEALAR